VQISLVASRGQLRRGARRQLAATDLIVVAEPADYIVRGKEGGDRLAGVSSTGASLVILNPQA
jgi:hypothetical protein